MDETRRYIKEIFNEDEKLVEELRKAIAEQHSVAEWEEYYLFDDDDKKQFIKGTLMKLIYNLRD